VYGSFKRLTTQESEAFVGFQPESQDAFLALSPRPLHNEEDKHDTQHEIKLEKIHENTEARSLQQQY